MSNYVDAVALTEQGVGISIFPQTTSTPNRLLVSKVITGSARQAEYVLVWPKGQQPLGVAGELLRYVQGIPEAEEPADPREEKPVL